MILLIGALKAISFLVLLNGRAIAFAVLKVTTELGAVSIANNALAMNSAIQELTFKDITTFHGQLATAIGCVILPFSHIGTAILPYQRSLSILGSLQQLSGITVAVGITEDSLTSAFSVDIVTIIIITIIEFIDALAILDVIGEVTNIGITVGITVSTLAVLLVVFPLSFVGRAVGPAILAIAILLVIGPLAIIEGTSMMGIAAFAMTLTHTPAAIIDITIIVSHNTVAFLFVTIP